MRLPALLPHRRHASAPVNRKRVTRLERVEHGLEARKELSLVELLLTPHTQLLLGHTEEVLDPIDELIGVERLREIRVRPQLVAAYPVGLRGLCGEDENLHRLAGAGGLDLLQYPVPVHLGHHD